MGRAASQIDGAWIPSRTGRPVKSRKKKRTHPMVPLVDQVNKVHIVPHNSSTLPPFSYHFPSTYSSLKYVHVCMFDTLLRACVNRQCTKKNESYYLRLARVNIVSKVIRRYKWYRSIRKMLCFIYG